MDIYRVKILKLDHQARGIAKINNKVIFIPYSLPNEIVDVEIIENKKNYMLGKIINIVSEHDRVKPMCPYFGICGGCDLQNYPYSKQLEFKYNKVVEIMDKYAKLNKDIINDIVPSIDIYNYRNKVTFKYNGSIGYFKKNSNDIVNIDYCHIASFHINRLIDVLNTLDIKDNVVVKSGINDLIIKDGVCINGLDVTYDFGILKYLVGKDSFFQINTKQAINMYNKILDLCDLSINDTVLDLYCGTGSIGLYLAHKCKLVIGVEIVKESIDYAIKNMEINNISNAKFYCGDAGSVLSKLDVLPDIVIVDPPRSGLDALAINNVIKLNSKKIIYVSCDPMTLARDLNILKEYYNIKSITPFDMFPQTYHVECVVLLERKD